MDTLVAVVCSKINTLYCSISAQTIVPDPESSPLYSNSDQAFSVTSMIGCDGEAMQR